MPGEIRKVPAEMLDLSKVGAFSLRNKIINGAMEIAQRSTNKDVQMAAGEYVLDRWRLTGPPAVVANVAQRLGTSANVNRGATSVVIAPKMAVPTLGANAQMQMYQAIEGIYVKSLIGKTFTLSFWVSGSTPGTYCVNLRGKDTNKSYIAEYVIAQANTWEFKTITVDGGIPVEAGWGVGNDVGLYVGFQMGASTDFHTTTPNQWVAGNKLSTSNQVNLFASATGRYISFTQIQLEEGIVATPFEYRPYGLELLLCQRYYEGTIVPTGDLGIGGKAHVTHAVSSVFYTNCITNFAVQKRTTPTVTVFSPATGATGKIRNLTTSSDITTGTLNNVGAGTSPDKIQWNAGTGLAVNQEYAWLWSASAEL